MRKLICVVLSSLICLGLIGVFVLKAEATPTGHNWLTEIGTFKELLGVDVDSSARVFIKINNTVWRSTDSGLTFSKVLDTGVAHTSGFLIRVDSNDRIFVEIYDGANYDTYRSIDHGDNWTEVLSDTPHLWRLAEMQNGTLLMNTYHTGKDALIYKSNDGGASWTVWQNLTGLVTDHIHFVRVNPYSDDIWIGCGDQTGAPLGYHNGTAWTWVYNTTNDYTFTDAIFDENYVYLMPDRSAHIVYRLPHRGTWIDRVDVINLYDDVYSPGIPYSMMAARYADGMMVIPTDMETIHASIDGIRWFKVAQLGYQGSGAWRLASISQRRPIYVANFYTDKLYRLDMYAHDIAKLVYHKWTVEKGTLINSEEYSYETIITNGTSYVDLSTVALQSVKATIIGLSRTQEITDNSGFETGDTSNWTSPPSPFPPIIKMFEYSVTSGESHSGSYSWNFTQKPDTNSGTLAINDATTPSVASDWWLISVWAKANNTNAILRIGFTYWTGSDWNWLLPDGISDYFYPTTTWQRFTFITTGLTESNMSFAFTADYNNQGTYQMFVDDVLAEKLYIRHMNRSNGGDGFVFKAITNDLVPDYYTETSNTTNPTITIDGQQVSHSGQLANGTASSPTSLSGILTGVISVNASIEGSGQAILQLNGTRLFYEDSVIIEGRANNVYYGRYYGTFSPTVNTTDLIAVTNVASNITVLSYKSTRLRLNIESYSGATSITKIYCGNKGNASGVIGATSWSYDNTTAILTINKTHTNTTHEINVFWPPSNVYTTEVVVGAIIVAGTGVILAYWYRRRKKTRTVTVP